MLIASFFQVNIGYLSAFLHYTVNSKKTFYIETDKFCLLYLLIKKSCVINHITHLTDELSYQERKCGASVTSAYIYHLASKYHLICFISYQLNK